MSNVLIGIIGVILFIGLALAGALILGDDFKSSKSDSDAAAIISQMGQASQALAMYELKTGQRYPDFTNIQDNDARLIPRFLKKAPEGRGGGRAVPFTQSSPAAGRRFVVLGGLSAADCEAIQRNLNPGTPVPTMTQNDTNGWGILPEGQAGCALQASGPNYLIWYRI